MRTAKIILLSTAAATAYGVAHDQITARAVRRILHDRASAAVSHEFAHTPGNLLGDCRDHRRGGPAWRSPGISFPIGGLAASSDTAAAEVDIGSIGGDGDFRSAGRRCRIRAFATGHFEPARPLADLVPPGQHDRFMAVWFAHGASYLAGVAGGLLMILRIWRQRGRPGVITVLPRSKGEIVRAVILAAIAGLVLWARFGKW